MISKEEFEKALGLIEDYNYYEGVNRENKIDYKTQDNARMVIKRYIEEKEKQKETLDILKENAHLYVNDVNKDVKSIQINITTCNDNFNKVEEWLENGNNI